MRATLVLALGMVSWLAFVPLSWSASPEPPERGTYLVLSDKDTLATEPFTRDGNDVSGRVIAGGRVLHTYGWSVGPSASIKTLEITVRPGETPADSASMHIFMSRSDQGMVMTFRDSTMRIDKTFAFGDLVQAGVSGSVAFMEQMVRRARALGDMQAKIPIFMPATQERWIASINAIGPDSTRIDLSGDTWRLETDASGHILGGVTESSGMRLGRLVHPAKATRRR